MNMQKKVPIKIPKLSQKPKSEVVNLDFTRTGIIKTLLYLGKFPNDIFVCNVNIIREIISGDIFMYDLLIMLLCRNSSMQIITRKCLVLL